MSTRTEQFTRVSHLLDRLIPGRSIGWPATGSVTKAQFSRIAADSAGSTEVAEFSEFAALLSKDARWQRRETYLVLELLTTVEHSSLLEIMVSKHGLSFRRRLAVFHLLPKRLRARLAQAYLNHRGLVCSAERWVYTVLHPDSDLSWLSRNVYYQLRGWSRVIQPSGR